MVDCVRLYERLLAHYGRQMWWPAEHHFEIMVGALLVQRTTWRNAVRALDKLKTQDLLNAGRLAETKISDIEVCIRSAGFYRMKARRLKTMARYVSDAGGTGGLAKKPTAELRSDLLELPGVGVETADAILLYAFERPAVVIDAYLRRLWQRLIGEPIQPRDSMIEAEILREIGDVERLNELHALVVEHGKRTCATVPRCAECCVRVLCRTGQAKSEA